MKNKNKIAINPTMQLISDERRKLLLDQIRQAEVAGADCIVDMSEEDRIVILRKNPTTGKWENDFEALNAIKEKIQAGNY
jgi:hypothetical protein